MKSEEYYNFILFKIFIIMNLSRLHITKTEDKNWLIDSTQKSKQEILDNLWIKTNSWVFNNIKEYLVSIFNTEK